VQHIGATIETAIVPDNKSRICSKMLYQKTYFVRNTESEEGFVHLLEQQRQELVHPADVKEQRAKFSLIQTLSLQKKK